MNGTARDYPPGDLRVSDADRDRAVSELTEAFQVGRITADEFDQRSSQVLSARTGTELAAPLADLPADRAPATAATAPVPRVAVRRIVIGASAVSAAALTAVAASDAASASGNQDYGVHRRLAEQVLHRLGLSVRLPVHPPTPGFDWAGTVTPAAFAVLLVALIVVLCVTGTGRNRTGNRSAGQLNA